MRRNSSFTSSDVSQNTPEHLLYNSFGFVDVSGGDYPLRRSKSFPWSSGVTSEYDGKLL
jgi:hypothetical protein